MIRFHAILLQQPTKFLLKSKLTSTPHDENGISLEFNDLSYENGDGYKYAFPHIPRHVVMLSLSDTKLSQLTSANLSELLLALENSSSVEILDLGHNELFNFEEELADIIAIVPSHITDLRLSNNGLGRMSTPALVSMLRALPPTISSIDLSRNTLGAKSTAEILEILSSVPVTVRKITLMQNQFTGKSEADLQEICDLLHQKFDEVELESKPAARPNPDQAPHGDSKPARKREMKVDPAPSAPPAYELLDGAHFQPLPPDYVPPTNIDLMDYGQCLGYLNTNCSESQAIQDLLNEVELLTRPLATDILRRTIKLHQDIITINDYMKFAATMSGKPSPTLQRVGYLMMAVATTLALTLLAAALLPTLNLGIVGVIASASDIAQAAAGSALVGLGIFGFNRPSGVYQKMEQAANSLALR